METLNNLNKMKEVDDIISNIVLNMEILKKHEVLSLNDSIQIIKTFTDKESEWMERNFSKEEIDTFFILILQDLHN